MTARLATGPVSWGVDFAQAPGNPPWPEVLDGIVAAGYPGLELGPVGYLPEEPERLADELELRGLVATAAFAFEPFHDDRHHERSHAAARRACDLIAAVGGRHLVLIDLVSPERARTAGSAERALRLDRERRSAMIGSFAELRTMAADAGIAAVVHPHAGTFVEFEDEIEAVAEVLDLCLDTGHLAYAGLDCVAVLEALHERVGLLHLKDLEPRVAARAVRGELDFWEAIAAGVFCPAGRGSVDFRAVAVHLDRRGYEGWATVEQDRVPGTDPIADLVESRRFLERAGFAA